MVGQGLGASEARLRKLHVTLRETGASRRPADSQLQTGVRGSPYGAHLPTGAARAEPAPSLSAGSGRQLAASRARNPALSVASFKGMKREM